MNMLTFSEARHLVSRTGLGVEWDSVKKLEGLTREKAVEVVLNPAPAPIRPAPAFTPWHKLEPMRDISAEGRKDAWSIAQTEGKHLQGWWIAQMLLSSSPFIERMTLFWHNYFPSSIQKTLQPSLLHKQNLMLRQHALGNFRNLLKAVARDPAMLVYLDGYENVKGRPNENFARELLELFTVGSSEYGQADVKAVAKVFTGWGVDQSGNYVFNADQHDGSPVTVLGRTRAFSGDELIDMLVEHPKTSERLVERVWQQFVSGNRPDKLTVQSLAAQFRRADYDIKALLRAVFNSPQFWESSSRGTLVKSPVELLIGTVRMANYPRESIGEMVNLCRLMGQQLFDPPNVRGWLGGEHWISTQTLLVRASYLSKVSRGNLNRRVDTGLRLPPKNQQEMLEWMLAVPPVNKLPDIPGNRRLANALMLDPAFQVS
ncbi:DUF1800 domain-containing protein [uncultured Thiothrix sp.]|uniref:DUF1800 domain-containing protein n=1 Tax=uncultured Thiothrix sp. TaxID=223185 RepID=UPI002625AF0E|nr:DUF1800 domain-containing protein [uncultured Thiothrix sp.]